MPSLRMRHPWRAHVPLVLDKHLIALLILEEETNEEYHIYRPTNQPILRINSNRTFVPSIYAKGEHYPISKITRKFELKCLSQITCCLLYSVALVFVTYCINLTENYRNAELFWHVTFVLELHFEVSIAPKILT